MHVKEAILNRRSIRVYTEQEVKRELITDLLATATYAPTHQMRESWRFILVDQDAKATLVDSMEAIFEGVPAEEAKVDYRKKVIQGATSLLIVVIPKFEEAKLNHEEMGAAFTLVQNFSLLAHEANLGSCIKTSLIEGALVKHLGINDDEQVVCALTLGYSDKVWKAKPRKDVLTCLTIL